MIKTVSFMLCISDHTKKEQRINIISKNKQMIVQGFLEKSESNVTLSIGSSDMLETGIGREGNPVGPPDTKELAPPLVNN